MRKAFELAFKNIPRHLKLSLTYDNGTEMAQHKLFTKNTKIKVFFAHPYSPWERPTNENTNGLIRDYFPKGTDFNLVKRKDLKQVQSEVNERPRKVLEYETPLNAISRLYSKKMCCEIIIIRNYVVTLFLLFKKPQRCILLAF